MKAVVFAGTRAVRVEDVPDVPWATLFSQEVTVGFGRTDNYFPHWVTYHLTCHSMRMLDVEDRPLRLLRNVRGIDLVELPRWDECCGFGGTFSVKNPDVSAAMLADKMEAVIKTGAEVPKPPAGT